MDPNEALGTLHGTLSYCTPGSNPTPGNQPPSSVLQSVSVILLLDVHSTWRAASAVRLEKLPNIA